MKIYLVHHMDRLQSWWGTALRVWWGMRWQRSEMADTLMCHGSV